MKNERKHLGRISDSDPNSPNFFQEVGAHQQNPIFVHESVLWWDSIGFQMHLEMWGAVIKWVPGSVPLQPQRGHCTPQCCVLKHWGLNSSEISSLKLWFHTELQQEAQSWFTGIFVSLAFSAAERHLPCWHTDTLTEEKPSSKFWIIPVYEYKPPFFFVYDFVLVLPHPGGQTSHWLLRAGELSLQTRLGPTDRGLGVSGCCRSCIRNLISHERVSFLPPLYTKYPIVPFTHNIPNFLQVPSPLLDYVNRSVHWI